MTDTLRSPGVSLLRVLVEAAGWRGDETGLVEAVPHLAFDLSADDYIATLKNLGLPLFFAHAKMREITGPDCPCLFVGRRGGVTAILDRRGKKGLVLREGAETPVWENIGRDSGTMVQIQREDEVQSKPEHKNFFHVFFEFRGLIAGLVAASFLTNLMALATPLLIMVIYDRVIPTRSEDFLFSLLAVVALFVVADVAFRSIRTHAIAYMGAKIEHRLGLSLFKKLMHMPLAQLQKSDVGQQLSRLKQFEGMRDIFSGQVFTTLLDLPFTLLFLAVVVILSPPVGVLILCLALIFVVATLITMPMQERLNGLASTNKAAHQGLLFEMTVNQRALQRLGGRDRWIERNRILAERAAESAKNAKQLQLITQTFGQSIMMAAGVGSIFLGTRAAMSGDMTFGGLIAVMALVWRVLSPIQSLFVSAPQIKGFLRSGTQVDRVLNLPEEFVRGAARSNFKAFSGRLALTGVTHRYAGSSDPAVSGVSLAIEQGELVVICGRNSAGKTTLLNLLDGLYSPVAGSIQLDGIDYRQIAVDDLRRAIGYAPQVPEIFHGTLAQNFRLSNPLLTDECILKVLADMGLTKVVAEFPEGIHTRLTETFQKRMSRAVFKSLVLCRAFSRDRPIYLFDEPCNGLDSHHERAFLDQILKLKGQRTVIMVTDRPSHFELADRIIFLDQGRVVVNDTGDLARRKVRALYTNTGGA